MEDDEKLSIISDAIKGIDEPKEADAAPTEEEQPATEEAATEEQPEEEAAASEEQPQQEETDPEADTPEAALKKEMDELGLKTRSRARFEKLTKDLSEAHQKLEGYKDFDSIKTRAQAADELESTIRNTGITPENFGTLMNVTADMNSGDPDRMRRAHQFVTAQAQYLEQQLGMSPEGLDPDLAQQVQGQKMTQEVALELMQHRRASQLHQSRNQHQERQQQAVFAQQEGARSVAAFEQSISSDPHLAAKMPTLKAHLASIVQTVPPQQWAASLQNFYKSLPNPAPAQKAPAVGAVPLRPTGASRTMTKTIDDPFEAMKAAVQGVKAA